MPSGWIGCPLTSARIKAGTSVRAGGVYSAAHLSLNLCTNTSDRPSNVAQNRTRFVPMLGDPASVSWMEQVHGTEVVERVANNAGDVITADAQWTSCANIVLTVLTADCLPVLFADRGNSCIAAAHAGWRGLADGVLQNTVRALPVDPGELRVWIGPAISGASYEVGEDVRQAFLTQAGAAEANLGACFLTHGRDKWLLDMPRAATALLASAGVTDVEDSGYCTYRDQRFFSYRRDGETGRQASYISLQR